MRVLSLVFAVLFAMVWSGQSSAQGQPSGGEAKYREFWQSFNGIQPIYGESVEGVCRDAYQGASPAAYNGDNYLRNEPSALAFENADIDRSCISNKDVVVGGVASIDISWPAKLVCRIEEANGTIRAGSEFLGRCPTEPCFCSGTTGTTIRVGNPVDLPSMAKVHREVDWQSSLDPRFAIVRHYRSDKQITERFGKGDPMFRQDPFSTHWSMNFSDELYTGIGKNPNNPDDTANYMVYVGASGGKAYFVRGASLAPLSLENGYSLAIEGTYTGETSRPFRVTDPQGVVYRFTWSGGAPLRSGASSSRHYHQTITWPDGYQITVERSFAFETARISVLRDNRAQRAEFVYSTDASIPPPVGT